MHCKIILSLIIAFFGVTSLHAQSFEDFKRAQFKSYSKYKEERDQAFKNYLTKEWKAYQLSQGKKLYEKPKPKTIPKTIPTEHAPVGPKVTIKIPKLPVAPKPVVEIKPEVPAKPVEKQFPEPKKPIQAEKKAVSEPDRMDFYFFGTKVSLIVPASMRHAKLSSYDQRGIAGFFDQLATNEYEKVLSSFEKQHEQLQLNDWGGYLLLKAVSEKLYNKPAEATLFSWFILNKQGYAVKVGLSGSEPVLLLHSKKVIYSTPNYSFGKEKYYAIEYYGKKGTGRLKTYPEKYQNADKPFNMSLQTMPDLHPYQKSKVLIFRYRGAEHTINVSYNKNLIDFMETYPQADYATYFNAPLSSENRILLLKQLKPMLDGKQASRAINFLLFFVQHAFEYQVDDQQFGREKVMFADETLYYNASDCEDRAVLFAYLVKELFNVDVIGVKYKDHMATAIAVPMKGETIKFGQSRYVIADPTYINASVGQSMPKYRNITPDSFIRVE
ncbi:MAG: hypothetical protein U9Q62_01015 [Campylobacterota bacterium]|nr:hypothetical protein [Campylobacterota bacterium]